MGRALRKKRKNLVSWQKAQRKRVVTGGLQHVSTSRGSKRLIRAKAVKPGCPATCRYRCGYRVPDEVRAELHKKFYSLETRDLQQAFIVSCVTRKAKKRMTLDDDQQREKKRENTFKYHITPAGEEEIQVCKSTFKATFDLSDGRIARALESSLQNDGVPVCDKRGKATRDRVSIECRKKVRAHIESFPADYSHYSRKSNPNVRYLSGDLNIRKMYDLFREKCEEEGTLVPVKESYYRTVFTEEYNLRFRKPRSDTCDTCDRLKMESKTAADNTTKQQKEAMLRLHQARAEKAYVQLKEDTDRAKGDPTVVCLCFDLQQALPTPLLATGVVFYKRQLYTYNFCIHNTATNEATMFMWSEDVAGRGSEEIASCVGIYIEKLSEETDIQELILYSDSCGGQNKNFTMLALLHLLCESGGIKKVQHKFLVPGHTFLPCDRNFGVIEAAKRRATSVFVPDDWCKLVQGARRKTPFHVVKMTQDDFLGFGDVTRCLIRRKTTDSGEKVKFSKAAIFEVSESQPLKTSVKQSHGALQHAQVLNHAPRRGRRPSLTKACVTRKYDRPVRISPAKKKDLLDLLKFIPPVHHGFYQALSCSTQGCTGKGKRAKTAQRGKGNGKAKGAAKRRWAGKLLRGKRGPPQEDTTEEESSFSESEDELSSEEFSSSSD